MRALLVCLLAVPAFAAPIPKEYRQKADDLSRIVGSWTPFPGGGEPWQFFADGTAKLPGRGSNEPPILFTMDPKSTPKTFMWKPSWGTWNGVYELKGDEFRIAIVSGNGARPTEAKPGTGYEYYEFRRAK